jgi:transposase
MADVRKHHSADFKRKLALEAIRQQKTMNQITAEYGVHASQITNWKKQALEGINQAFVVSRKSVETDRQVEIDELHRQLGQVIAERDWLKKNRRISTEPAKSPVGSLWP